MNTIKKLLLSTAFFLVASTTFAQSSVLQAGFNDLRSERLQKAPEAPLANARHERVTYSAAVGPDY